MTTISKASSATAARSSGFGAGLPGVASGRRVAAGMSGDTWGAVDNVAVWVALDSDGLRLCIA